MQELLVNVVRRDRDWRPKRPRILFEHLLLHWPLFAEGLERLDTVPESSFEEIPRPVVFACFFVQIQSIEVWHTKNVLWLMSIDQKFDCKGRSEPCRVLCQILRRRESKDGFRSAFPINACKSIIHCFPLNLGYQSLRMGCLRDDSCWAHLIRSRKPHSYPFGRKWGILSTWSPSASRCRRWDRARAVTTDLSFCPRHFGSSTLHSQSSLSHWCRSPIGTCRHSRVSTAPLQLEPKLKRICKLLESFRFFRIFWLNDYYW